MPSVTLTLQLLQAALNLTFGLLAFRVVVAERGDRAAVEAWRAMATAFTLLGAHGLLHSLAAVWAVAEGSGSRVWEVYLALLPEANGMRGCVALGTALFLGWRVWHRPEPTASPWPMVAFFAAMLAAGYVLGVLEGDYSNARHFTVMNAMEIVTVGVLFAALVRAMALPAVDYFLWFALAVYGLRQVVNVLLTSGFAWIGAGSVWTPEPFLYPAIGVLSLAFMNAAAWLRVRAAGSPRRSRPVLDFLLPLRGGAAP